MTKPEGKSKTDKNKLSKFPLYISIAIVASLVISYFAFSSFHEGVNEAFKVITSDDEKRIGQWVKQFGALGPIVIMLAMIVQMFLLVIPNLLLFIIAILCYGPIWGSLICLGGVFLSSSLGYFIGKRLGPKAIDKLVSEDNQLKIKVFIKRYGVKAIAIARASSFSSDALSFVGGILEMSYKKYILATMVGIVPVVVLIAIYGNSGKVEQALIWLAGIGLAGLITYIIIDRGKFKKDYADEKD